jgi:hypothetical protein
MTRKGDFSPRAGFHGQSLGAMSTFYTNLAGGPEVLENDIQAIMDRAQDALQIIETAIGNNPTSGQAGRLVRFLAGLYNGSDYPFDLTDLRALDTRLANACLDYLNYDRLGKREVHRHLTGGDRRLHQWLEDYGIKPRGDHDTD